MSGIILLVYGKRVPVLQGWRILAVCTIFANTSITIPANPLKIIDTY
jgi:hypothetical protein